jgi:hypothetical protein
MAEHMPPVDDMLKMKYGPELVRLTRSANVESNLGTSFQCHKCLLKYYDQQGLINPQKPVRNVYY